MNETLSPFVLSLNYEPTFQGNPGGQNTLQPINIVDSSCKLWASQTGLNRTLDWWRNQSWCVPAPRHVLHPGHGIFDPSAHLLAQATWQLAVEMRKQCPFCLSNKCISPLHRWGLLMRDEDDCLSALPSSQQQRKHRSGKSVLHSDCTENCSKHNGLCSEY